MNKNYKNKFRCHGFYSFQTLIFIFFIILHFEVQSQDKENSDFEITPKITFIRAYGSDDEMKPPVLIIPDKGSYVSQTGSDKITIEMDVAANIPPAIYATFVHCTADWNETGNIFLNNITQNRTTLFEWEPAPMYQHYYGYKAKLTVPNQQVKFNFSGNWKVRIYEMNKDEFLAETRFFIVQPRAECYMGMSLDFYKTVFQINSTAVNIEGAVSTNQNLMDGNANLAVLYKNHRWYEPYFISDKFEDHRNDRYRYKFKSWVRGIIYNGKSFRIDGLPAENSYRVLNLADIAYFPPGPQPIRLPFSDLRRNGTFIDIDDDGAMITNSVPPEYKDYVLVEFVLDPQGVISSNDVFVTGSFNHWNPDAHWQMFYNPDEDAYKLRAWVPRARHNYLYSTGKLDFDNNQISKYSNDEFEGNTTTGNQTYLMFFYYREVEYGGYDSIIAVSTTSVSGNFFK